MVLSRKWTLVWLLLALFILSRILFLFFAYPSFFLGIEELCRGVLAQEIVTGRLNRPFFDYQIGRHAGGALAVGLLAVPFFLLFGISAFTLKLVGLTFFAATLLVWILFIFRFFGRNVAAFFSILFIFSPVFFTKMSLTTLGWHSETVFFTAVTIFIFYEIFFKQKQRWPYFIALGLVCGIGLWFAYTFGITLFTLILCWFFFERKFLFRKNFWIFSLGFLSGFGLWIYYNLTHSFKGLYIHGKFLPDFFAVSNIFKIFDFKESVIRIIPASLGLSNIWIFDRRLLSVAYFLVFVVAFIWMLQNTRKNLLRSKESFFIIYCFAISIAYQLTYCLALRYLIPLYPFIFITIALFLNRLFESKTGFRMVTSIVLVFLLVFMGFCSSINAVSTRFAGYGLKVKGLLYYGLGLLSAWDYEKDTKAKAPEYFSFARKIDPAYHDIYFRRLGENLEFQLQDLDKLPHLIKEVDPKYRRHLYAPIGWEISSKFRGLKHIDKAKELISRIEPEYQHYVYKTWIEDIACYNQQIDFESKKRMVAEIGKEYYPVFYKALGQHAGLDYFDTYSKIDEEYLPYFFEGVGKAIALRFAYWERKVEVSKLLKSIDEIYQPFACQGIGRQIALMIRDEPANILIWNRLLSELPALYQRYCQKGFEIEYPLNSK